MRTVAFAASALVSACLLSACTATNTSPQAGEQTDSQTTQKTGARDDLGFTPEEGEPCWHAERRSLAELVDVSDVPVWMPDSPRASRATLTGAWTCAGGHEPVLTFPDIEVLYESGWDAPIDWERKAADYPGGEVRTILGRPGLLWPATGPGVQSEVMVVIDGGLLIRVLGDAQVPIDDLAAVADSINLREHLTG